MRSFLAVPVAEPARPAVLELLQRLRAEVPGVAWARDESPHLTLHFWSDLPTEAVPGLLRAVETVAASTAPLDLRLGGGGAFPSWRRPAVLWLGVEEGGPRLSELAERSGIALTAAGFPVDDRPHRPHCTLGRPRQPWPAGARAACRSLLDGATMPAFQAPELVLMESVRTGAGFRHEPRGRLPLLG